MDKKTTSLVLSAILLLALSACNLGGGSDPTAGGDPSLLLPAVAMTVQADTAAPITAVGQTIQYTYVIRNTGAEPIPGVVNIIGATAICQPVNTIGNMDEFLDLDETITCVSSHTVTQADLDAGSITSVTTADVNGTLSSPVTTTVNTAQTRVLTLTKTASPQVYDQVGQTITYTYVITNISALDVGPAQFTVTDVAFSAPINCGNPDTTLAPNATVTCSATYTITQADMNVDSISTSATASGGSVGPSEPASAVVTRSGLIENPNNLPIGSTIQHRVAKGEWLWQIARCYGADPGKTVQANTQLADPAMISPDMTVTVPNIGTVGNIYGPPCVGTHIVQSGETWESIALKYNADPLVLQIVNAYSMPVGTEIKVPLNSAGGSVTLPIKSLKLSTSADQFTYSQLGQVITFTYVIENSGNATLGPAQFTITDSLVSATPINCGGADTTLTPGATVTCTAIYTITEADMNATAVTNNATASGGGATPSQAASVTVNKNIPSTSSLALTAAANPQTYNQAGQTINFTFVIRNSGNTTLGPAQFTLTDSRFGSTAINCGAADTTLTPDTTVTCTIPYTTTQADVDAGSIVINATASGGGAGPAQPATVTVDGT
ncbi:MAG TPA: LysM peptidoglycan-binding domain-containing protein [Anaerolineales bacterium]|nr:LysM peptidoglycan-binding domain-containing protein [Anaerolineales bacterium]